MRLAWAPTARHNLLSRCVSPDFCRAMHRFVGKFAFPKETIRSRDLPLSKPKFGKLDFPGVSLGEGKSRGGSLGEQAERRGRHEDSFLGRVPHPRWRHPVRGSCDVAPGILGAMVRMRGEGRRSRGAAAGVMLWVVLLLAIGTGSSRAQIVCDEVDQMCDLPGVAVTPKNGTVIQVVCQYDDFVRCPAVSWHTVFVAANTTGVVMLSRFNGITAPGSQVEPCNVPTTGVFTNSSSQQTCGNTPVTIGGLGQQYMAVRQTFKPFTYYSSAYESYVCFHMKGTSGQNLPERCIYFQTLVRPRTVQLESEFLTVGTNIRVSIGQTLRLRLWTYHVMGNVGVDIDLKQDGCDRLGGFDVLCPSPELPNQRWEGPTTCTPGNATVPTVCERYLIYSPFKSEDGQQYTVAFQGKIGQGFVPQRTGPVLESPGVACGTLEGTCETAPFLDVALTNYRVTVSTLAPVFESYDAGRTLFSAPGVRTDPAVLTLPGTPLDGSLLPKAFINCPLSGFGIYVSKEGADPQSIDIDLMPVAPGEPDASATGLQVSRPYYAAAATGGDNPVDSNTVDENTRYFKYIGLTWTPQPGAMGQVFKICFRASEKGIGPTGQQIEVSASQACVSIEIEPCMYCTVQDDTLQSIAARFRTTWTQIWSANYAGWYDLDPSMSGSDAQPWQTTKDPDTLRAGMLIRLGPVYRAQHTSPLERLAHRFQTTMDAIHAANPQLGNTTGLTIEAGEQICILPDICTMEGSVQ